MAADLADEDIRYAFYGDTFREPGEHLGVGDDVVTVDDLTDYEREMLRLWFEEAQRIDPELVGPADETLTRTPKSVQAMLRLLSGLKFFESRAPDRLMLGDLVQVRWFFTQDDVREKAVRSVLDCVDEDTRVVVGHSLGSVVAYEALCRLGVDGPVRAFVTLGSPLGIRGLVFNRLRPPPESDGSGGLVGRWPGGVTSPGIIARCERSPCTATTATTDLLNHRPTVFVGDVDGVRAWDLKSGTPSPPPWQAHRIGVVSALVTAELGGRPILLTTGGDGRIAVWDRQDGTPLVEPLPGAGPDVHALAAVGSGPLLGRLRFAVAASEEVRVGVLSHEGASVACEDEAALSIGSKVLALAWVDHRTLSVGGEMGIVTLRVRDGLSRLPRQRQDDEVWVSSPSRRSTTQSASAS
jgi:hypothetical protein